MQPKLFSITRYANNPAKGCVLLLNTWGTGYSKDEVVGRNIRWLREHYPTKDGWIDHMTYATYIPVTTEEVIRVNNMLPMINTVEATDD